MTWAPRTCERILLLRPPTLRAPHLRRPAEGAALVEAQRSWRRNLVGGFLEAVCRLGVRRTDLVCLQLMRQFPELEQLPGAPAVAARRPYVCSASMHAVRPKRHSLQLASHRAGDPWVAVLLRRRPVAARLPLALM
jgi:hypothetical protein